MSKIALITDTHWGVRNDSQIFHSYFEKFYSEVFFPYLKENNITKIIHLGDIVDRRKFINYVTLNAFREVFIKPCIENNIELHVIIGNHDVTYRNSNHINSMNELFGESYEKRNVHSYAEATDIELYGTKIALVPWINSSNRENALSFIENTKSQILLGHLEIEGFTMYLGGVMSHGLSNDLFKKFDLVCSGHFHHKSQKENIHYLGSPYETTWNDYNDNRGFHILDTSNRELSFIKNPFKMFHKLFYDDSNMTINDIKSLDFNNLKDTYLKLIIVKKEDPYIFDKYMDKLYNSNPAHINIVEDHHNYNLISEDEILEEAEDTLTVLNKFIDNNYQKNNTELKALFSNLLNEAHNIEL